MPPGNADILRRLFDAFNRQDAAAVRELWTTDCEWRPAIIGGGVLEGAVFNGHSGLGEFMRIQGDTWESVNASPVTIREIDNRVLVEVQLRAVGRASGAPVDQITWNVFEIRDGKVASGRSHTSREDALEALDLSE